MRVFYLFYLRLVQLPHQLVKGEPSSRWWAEQMEQSGTEILQKILGYADYSTAANIYVHTDIEELVKAVE